MMLVPRFFGLCKRLIRCSLGHSFERDFDLGSRPGSGQSTDQNSDRSSGQSDKRSDRSMEVTRQRPGGESTRMADYIYLLESRLSQAQKLALSRYERLPALRG